MTKWLNLDVDGNLTANSDTTVASQKAIKTYVDTGLGGKADTSTVTGINTRLSSAEDSLALHDTDISALEADMSSAQTSITSLNTATTTQAGLISSLQSGKADKTELPTADGTTVQESTSKVLTAVGTKNVNASSTNTVLKTWQGTKAQWLAGRADGSIGDDVVCQVTDDDVATPSLATVAITGSYNDLIDKPTIPTSSGGVTCYTYDVQIWSSSFGATSGTFRTNIGNKPLKGITTHLETTDGTAAIPFYKGVVGVTARSGNFATINYNISLDDLSGQTLVQPPAKLVLALWF